MRGKAGILSEKKRKTISSREESESEV